MTYTTSTAFLETLSLWGITHCFVNLGSDHPSIVEAFAEAKVNKRNIPRIITAPHEFVAVSAAQGFYQATGKIAAVILHVDVGLQNAGGAIHNLFRSRTPCLIFAGLSPLTQEGELRGSRNEFIQWVQDNHDQAALVRDYSKFTYEIRTGRNVTQVVSRAIQIAYSEPMGPVYLLGSREPMEEEVPPVTLDLSHWQPVPAPALSPEAVDVIVSTLLNATSPLVITTTLGRDQKAIPELVKLADMLAIAVLDSVPFTNNFPADHDMYAGVHWSGQGQNELLSKADVVLVLDSDIPWIPTQNKPHPDAIIIHIDIDPLKSAMPLFYIPARYRYTASAREALRQITSALSSNETRYRSDLIISRWNDAKASKSVRLARLKEVASKDSPSRNTVTVPAALSCLKAVLPPNSIILSEAITNYPLVAEYLAPGDSGTFFTSGASALGWHGGAAVGAALAKEAGLMTKAVTSGSNDPVLCAITGDGSWIFSVPSSVHSMASRYGLHFITVVLCNGGWRAPKMSALAVHPNGYSSRATAEELGVSFGPPETRPLYADLANAAAGGGNRVWGTRVTSRAELREAFERAVDSVRGGSSAVVEIVLPELPEAKHFTNEGSR